MSFELQDNITKSYNKVDNFLDGLENNSKEEKLDFKAAFKEGKIIVRKIEIARDEYEKNTEEYKELTSILERATTEYQELERTIIQAGLSEGHISQEERKSIMLELSDIIQIEENQKDITDNFRFIDKVGGLFDKFGWGVSEDRVERVIEESMNARGLDSKRVKEKEAKEITENALKFFNEADNKSLTGAPLYQVAFKEELSKQKSEFDGKYKDYLNGKINIEELESEMDDIDLLNIDMLSEALLEGASYFIGDLFSSDNPNLPEMKKRLSKMNLIYLASRANDLEGTELFKEERDEVATKIVKLEEGEGISIGEHETRGTFTYDINKIKDQILSGNFNNIDKYELFYYIKNEHSNFSNDTIKQLLTEYPRNFIEYLSVQFLKDKGMLNILFNEEKNSENVKFLESISNIDKVLNLNNVNDLNLATDEFESDSKEYNNAKEKLNDPILRKKFLETICNDPDNLNKYLQELKEYTIGLEFDNTKSELTKEILLNEPNLNNKEIQERLDLYKNDILDGIKNGLKGDKLAKYLIEKGHTGGITKKLLSTTSSSFKKINNITQEARISIKNSEHLSTKQKESSLSQLEDEVMNNEVVIDTTEKINLLNNQDFEILRDKLSQGETFDEIDEYFSENNEDYKKLLEKQSIKNSLIEHDFIENQSPIYQDYQIDNNGEGSFLISEENKEKIKITAQEAELVENNPEALKNLIDTKEKLDTLGLDFIWKYRTDYINTMKSTPGFIDSQMDTGDDFINPVEFNNLLRFTLSLLGENPTNSYSGNISKIVKLSSVSETDNKTHFITGYGKIGTQLKEMGYIGESSIDTNNVTNMQNYKQTIIDFKTKKEA